MATFSKIISMAKANTVGLTVGSIMDSGWTTKWRARVLSPGATAEDMRVTIRMIKSTDMEPSSGQMVGSISVTGAKVNNTERVCTSKRARRDKVSGRWARELSGSKMPEAQLTSEPSDLF